MVHIKTKAGFIKRGLQKKESGLWLETWLYEDIVAKSSFAWLIFQLRCWPQQAAELYRNKQVLYQTLKFGWRYYAEYFSVLGSVVKGFSGALL